MEQGPAAGVVIGNYQLLKKLGEGGMGAVYLGQHTLLGRRAAIKVLLPALSARPDIVNRFFNEARAVTSISDPGIVQVFDFGYHTDGSAFIVMEYLEGEPLDRRMARYGRLPVHEVLRLGRQLANSLAAAHAQHIVHRDLKPENIFLVPDIEVASGERPKILDFGIAKLSDDHPGHMKTHTGMLMGTPVYMSPEQCRGLADIDHRSDIYALGCVLFHLMTGRPPFEGEAPGDILSAHIREPALAPSSRVPEIPPAVDALVLRCLAKLPGDRFSSMGELSAALAGLQQGSGFLPDTQPPHHMMPTTRMPPGGMAPPSATLVPASAQPMRVPTTLGTSSGQFANATSGRSRRWRLIVTGFVGAIAAVIVVVVIARRSEAPGPATQTEPRMIESRSSGGDGGGTLASSERGAVAPAASPDSPSAVAVGSGDAGPVADTGQTAGATEARSDTEASSPRKADASAGEPGKSSRGSTTPSSAGREGPTAGADGATEQGGPGSVASPRVGASASSSSSSKTGASTSPSSKARASGSTSTKAGASANTSSKAGSSASTSTGLKAGSGSTADTGSTRHSSQHKHATTAGEEAPAAIQPPSTSTAAPSNCGKAVFAAVYNAAAPTKDAVRGAIRALNACHAAGAINDADYEQTQAGLVARL